MATSRSFQDMLNEYLPNELFKDELMKRDWYLQNIQKDDKWKGGTIPVPFMGASASSIKFGGLTDSGDISEFKPVRGSITGYKEVWGSLIFNETDIMQHDGKVNEQSFLKILPDQIEEFINYMKMAVSINLMAGPHYMKQVATLGTADLANGIVEVDKIDRAEIGMKLDLDDDNSAPQTIYITAVNINNSTVTVSASRAGAALDVSAYTVAQNGKFYHDGILAAGAVTNNFISAKSALLTVGNGGSSTIHGQTKTAYPVLQALNINGSSMTATNFLDKLFDFWSQIKIKAKAANPSKCVMSFKHLGTALKLVELEKSPFKVTPGSMNASLYNWTEVNITGVRGGFNLVGIQEMDDDIIFFLDMSAMTFRSNGFFQKKKAPGGEEFFRIRGSSGFQLVCDICLFGEQEFKKPATCAIVHTISY